jgi:hypothetical protein
VGGGFHFEVAALAFGMGFLTGILFAVLTWPN